MVSLERALGDTILFLPWLDHPGAPAPESQLIGRTDADLVVVGGGFTGM